MKEEQKSKTRQNFYKADEVDENFSIDKVKDHKSAAEMLKSIIFKAKPIAKGSQAKDSDKKKEVKPTTGRDKNA